MGYIKHKCSVEIKSSRGESSYVKRCLYCTHFGEMKINFLIWLLFREGMQWWYICQTIPGNTYQIKNCISSMLIRQSYITTSIEISFAAPFCNPLNLMEELCRSLKSKLKWFGVWVFTTYYAWWKTKHRIISNLIRITTGRKWELQSI